jgi:hypothetical protein
MVAGCRSMVMSEYWHVVIQSRALLTGGRNTGGGAKFLVPRLERPRLSAMGLTFSNLFNSLSSLVRWSKDQDVRILMLGLDSAGKVRCIGEITVNGDMRG